MRGVTAGYIQNTPNEILVIDLTKNLGKYALNKYREYLDPTISYSDPNHIGVYFETRKNGIVGTCRRIPRIINYNLTKVNCLDKSHLIELVSHEVAHLIFDGHRKEWKNVYESLFNHVLEGL